MRNMVWQGQFTRTVIGNDKVNLLTAVPHYCNGVVTIVIQGEGAIEVHIDELREIIQRYDARI